MGGGCGESEGQRLLVGWGGVLLLNVGYQCSPSSPSLKGKCCKLVCA